MSNSITITIPTIGRPTLIHTLNSLASQTQIGDVVHVCHEPGAKNSIDVGAAVRQVGRYAAGSWTRDFYTGKWEAGGHWGHAARNWVLHDLGVDTDLVWTIDDDDIATVNALATIRKQEAPWTIYRMHFGNGHPARGITCWRWKQLQHGDIGTPMIAAKPSKATYGLHYSGDWDYAQGLHAELGDPVWDDTIIALIRPEEVNDAA